VGVDDLTASETASGPVESTTHASFCNYCVAECGILVTVRGEEVIDVRGDPDHPTSQGYVCSKGRAIGRAHHDPHRLDHASMGRGSERHLVPLDAMLGDLAHKLDRIRAEHGPDAIAIYNGGGGQMDFLGGTLAEKLARALGTRGYYTTNSIDSIGNRTAIRMMAGHNNFFPTIDYERASLVVMFGANPLIAHGHTWSMPVPVRQLRGLSAQGEVWVFDPRTSETAARADRHVQLLPGSDHAVIAYAIRELLRDGADEQFLADHAVGVESLREAVEPFTLELAATRAGIAAQDLLDFVAAIRVHGRMAGVEGTGVTFSTAPVVTSWLLLALNIVTGSMERPGGLWFNPGFWSKLEEQAYAPLAEPGPGPASRPELRSWCEGQLPTAALLDEMLTKNVRALVVFGGNPVVAFPNHEKVMAALSEVDVLAVCDVIDGDMTSLATHVMPAAGTLERTNGNMTASFQPIVLGHMSPPVVPGTADRRPQWWFVAELARLLGVRVLPDGLGSDASDHDVLQALYPNVRVPLDELEAHPSGMAVDVERVPWVTERVLADGRWQVAPQLVVNQLARLDRRPPEGLLLLSRRQRHRLNSILRDLDPPAGVQFPMVFLNEVDADRLRLTDGVLVRVRSEAGAVVAQISRDGTLREGTAAMSHGYRYPNVNLLTSDEIYVDEICGMPLYSGIPVSIESVTSAEASDAHSLGRGL